MFLQGTHVDQALSYSSLCPSFCPSVPLSLPPSFSLTGSRHSDRLNLRQTYPRAAPVSGRVAVHTCGLIAARQDGCCNQRQCNARSKDDGLYGDAGPSLPPCGATALKLGVQTLFPSPPPPVSCRVILCNTAHLLMLIVSTFYRRVQS